ncbi:unnamed protein product [Thelazia callipaeda]|uniref:LysM domain-containing protein n=1 Tax=Thelazia callipaeda TaxID=103827 RepID=A0A0N5DAV6_THECL|nr:unnamed protein product [Thelazia callipaeda]
MINPHAVEGSSTENIELRVRNAIKNNGENRNRWDKSKSFDKVVIIEKKLKPGDNLNKIAIQYSVSVILNDLKRANNIVSEQDIYALPFIKIPVSKLRKELDLEHGKILMRQNSPDVLPEDLADDRPLLSRSDSSDKSVEELFVKTDAYIAQARNNLPTASSIDGAVHFVNASSPDTSFKVCCVNFLPVMLSIFIKLLFTLELLSFYLFCDVDIS